mmetsp:Transcript_7987/g.7484  ORF Transcript_7987/g.7484 Transcript_7987/m.7484 type:complete len:120 (+) Transcript_7987:1533-1892(+)
MVLAKFAGIVIQKDNQETLQRKDLLLRERVNKHGMSAIENGVSLKELTVTVKNAMVEMFNAEKSRLIIIDEKTKNLKMYKDSGELVEVEPEIGISGDLIKRELNRVVLVLNPYEDSRYN